MDNPPRSWRNFTAADYAGLDFGWMKESLQSSDGPLKDNSLNYLDAPLPNYELLQRWAKLRAGEHRGPAPR